MRKLFDFKCPSGHTEEHLVTSDQTHARCSCGLEAHRIISPVKCYLDPVSGHFPGATMRWIREHEQAANKTKEA